MRGVFSLVELGVGLVLYDGKNVWEVIVFIVGVFCGWWVCNILMKCFSSYMGLEGLRKVYSLEISLFIERLYG